MTRLYANENVELSIVLELRRLGHDVLTSLEAGRSNKRIPDADVLEYATSLDRSVLTHDWKDFRSLHKTLPSHGGIIGFPPAADSIVFAQRINIALAEHNPMRGKFLRVTPNEVRLIERPGTHQTGEREVRAPRATPEPLLRAAETGPTDQRPETNTDRVRTEPPDALLEE